MTYKCSGTIEGEGRVFSLYEMSAEDMPHAIEEGANHVVVYSDRQYQHQHRVYNSTWRGAFVVFPQDKTLSDVESDLLKFVQDEDEGKADLEAVFGYLDEPSRRRLLTGGGDEPRYSSWNYGVIDRADVYIDSTQSSWIVVCTCNRDSEVLEREIYLGLKDVANEAGDSGVEDLRVAHWGWGWIDVLIVEPCSPAHDAVKPYLDGKSNQDLAEQVAQYPHLANVFELYVHAQYMSEDGTSEASPKVSLDQAKSAVSFILNADDPEDQHERYIDIYIAMCEEAGLEFQ